MLDGMFYLLFVFYRQFEDDGKDGISFGVVQYLN